MGTSTNKALVTVTQVFSDKLDSLNKMISYANETIDETLQLVTDQADALQRVRDLQQEWEANGNQRLTTEPGPFEKHSHYFAGQLRKALDGEL